MNELERELFEKRLLSLSKGFEYPRTPNIAHSVIARLQPARQPRFFSRPVAWSLTIILIVFSSLMLIPPARAVIIEFIQVGVVRIFPRAVEATPTPTPEASATSASQLPGIIPLLNQIAGKTTLDQAQQNVSFSILLPAHPESLGKPDHVFVQEAEGAMVVLVWMDPEQSEQVLLSLHFIPSGSWAIQKVEPVVIERTDVNGYAAVWATGPYALKASSGSIEFIRLIDGHVLIWTVDEVTYRLETALSLEEALKIAESLEPYSP